MSWEKKAKEGHYQDIEDRRNEVKEGLKDKLGWDIDNDESVTVTYKGAWVIIDDRLRLYVSDWYGDGQVRMQVKCPDCKEWRDPDFDVVDSWDAVFHASQLEYHNCCSAKEEKKEELTWIKKLGNYLKSRFLLT